MKTAKLLLRKNQSLGAWVCLCLGLSEPVLKAEPLFGSKPWVTILVRFSDSPAVTPHPKSWYEALMGTNYPGMDHYFREVSHGQINLTGSTVVGWYNLPHPKSYYTETNSGGAVSFNVFKILPDAAATADAAVFFPSFYGVNVMLNENLNGIGSGNGSKWYPSPPLDGTPKTYGITVQQPPTGPNPHEMGHGFGLDHTSGPYFPDEPLFGPHTYDSRWDPTSAGGDCSPGDPTYGCVYFHYNAYHKDLLGWIPAARKYVPLSSDSQTIEIERLALPGTNGYLMAQIFMSGWATRFYTVEVRRRAGYDGNGLPAEGVLIHSVDTTRIDRQSQIVDGDKNGNPNDAGAVWTTGETFNDTENGVTITVGDRTPTGYRVTISLSSSTPLPNIVTNTKDGGPGSLRNAIAWANLFRGTTIAFQIPNNDTGFSNGVFTIKPTRPLPAIIGDATVIDGSSQSGFVDKPLIQVTGSDAGADSQGFELLASGGTIRSLSITAFGNAGIRISGASAFGNRIEGCYIGINAAGTTGSSNRNHGVMIAQGAHDNTIGGESARQRNVLSGNGFYGIICTDANTGGNRILNNYIGTDASGTKAIANGFAGILLISGASSNIVGGAFEAARNVISGNSSYGLLIYGPNAASNVVLGNLVGTDATGHATVKNGHAGIGIRASAQSNVIGGISAGDGNLISGNGSIGLEISEAGSVSNRVIGNIIGANRTGRVALPNGWAGVQIGAGASNNSIGDGSSTGRNIISGNLGPGLWVGNAGTTNNSVLGNYIGTDKSGSARLPNGHQGIIVVDGARNTRIGGTLVGEGNVISGNSQDGVGFLGIGTKHNLVEGNFIGTDASGEVAMGNGYQGVFILGGAENNIIGGSTPNARNVISGNVGLGIWISDAGTRNNWIQGNFIGTRASGTNALANGSDAVIFLRGAQNNVLGLRLDGSGGGNRIAFNTGAGVLVLDPETTGNVIRGNQIFGNQRLDINLWGGVQDSNGITANDAGDSDTGPNNLQNFPSLTDARAFGSAMTVRGILNSHPNRSYALDFFASHSSTFSTDGHYLGGLTVFTDSSGVAPFAFAVSGAVTGQWINATATDLNTGDSSEFSHSIASGVGVDNPPSPLLRFDRAIGDDPLSLGVNLEPNRNYRLQASTNLSTWLDLTNFSSGASDIYLRDTNSTNFSRRFYRLVSP